MIKSKKIAIILGLSLLFLYGCTKAVESKTDNSFVPQNNDIGNIENMQNMENLSKLFALSDWVEFVNVIDANKLLYEKGSYFSELRDSEKKYYFELVDESSNTLIIDSSRLARSWDVNEEDKILKEIFKIEEDFANLNLKFKKSIPIIKILGHSRLPDVFVIKSGIVISENALNMSSDELESELIQCLFAYYLNNNIDLKNNIIKKLGFIPLENLSIPEVFADYILIRPEFYQPYAIKAVREDINTSIENSWTPISLINPSNNKLKDYMVNIKMLSNNKAIVDKVINNNIYLPSLEFMNNYLAVPSSEIKIPDGIDGIDFKNYNGNFIHPNDIICKGFEKLVLKRFDDDDFVVKVLQESL